MIGENALGKRHNDVEMFYDYSSVDFNHLPISRYDIKTQISEIKQAQELE